AHRGDRLVFSNGILVLSGLAGLLIIAFGGITNALIPLYAVGVFTSFTLSQTRMVIHHLPLPQPPPPRTAVINATGAVATGIVTLIVAVTKFTNGAWVPIIVIPAIVLLFKGIHRHYQRVRAQLTIPPDYKPPPMNHTVVVLVGGMHRGVLHALAYAKSLNPTRVLALSVGSEQAETGRTEKVGAEPNT